MKLYFENKFEEMRLIGTPASEEEAIQMMYDFCEERSFKVYYVRSWKNKEKNMMQYDVGSHSEFFYLQEG